MNLPWRSKTFWPAWTCSGGGLDSVETSTISLVVWHLCVNTTRVCQARGGRGYMDQEHWWVSWVNPCQNSTLESRRCQGFRTRRPLWAHQDLPTSTRPPASSLLSEHPLLPGTPPPWPATHESVPAQHTNSGVSLNRPIIAHNQLMSQQCDYKYVLPVRLRWATWGSPVLNDLGQTGSGSDSPKGLLKGFRSIPPTHHPHMSSSQSFRAAWKMFRGVPYAQIPPPQQELRQLMP